MKRGLKGQLIQSNLLIALFAVSLLIASIIGLTILKKTIDTLTKSAIPTVELTQKLQLSLVGSLASLRGWMSVEDVRFKKERKSSWENGIMPSLTELGKLEAVTKNKSINEKLIKVKEYIEELRTTQWQIEDIAQTLGNNPSLLFFKGPILESTQRMQGYLSILLADKTLDDNSGNALYEVSVNLSELKNNLTEYLLTDNNIFLIEAQKKLDNLKKKASDLSKINLQDKEKKDLLDNLKNSLDYLPNLIEQSVRLKKEKGDSVAREMLKKRAVPIVRTIERLLSDIDRWTKERQEVEIKKTIVTSNLMMVGTILAVIVLTIFSIWRANRDANHFLKPISLLLQATKKILKGETKQNIKVIGEDEISELTIEFNHMIRARNESEEKMNKVFEMAIEPIVTINSYGIVQSVNKATVNLLGYKKEELLGNNIANIMLEPHRSSHDQYLSNYLKTRVRKIIGTSRDVQAKTKRGELIDVRLSVSEFKINGQYFFSGIIHDLREEKKKESDMKTSNKLLEKELYKEKVYGALDKEIRKASSVQDFALITISYIRKLFGFPVVIFNGFDKDKKIIEPIESIGTTKKNC